MSFCFQELFLKSVLTNVKRNIISKKTKKIMPMNTIYLSERLKQLEEIAANPNAKNGIWNSFSLFISISDEILESLKDFNGNIVSQAASENIIKDLQSIRPGFEKISGIKLETQNLGLKFEKAKNNVAKAHKFKAQISKFLKGYQGHFLKTNN